jgi:hypothetical protein
LTHSNSFAGDRKEKVKKVTFNYITTEIKIRYDKGHEDWADFIMSGTSAYIPAVENYLGWTFPHEVFIINGGEKILSPSGEQVGGYNRGEEIDLQYDLVKQGNPGLLYHELNHAWFLSWGQMEIEWFIEGICSFLPVAIRDSGLLSDEYVSRENIFANWNLKSDVSSIEDEPLSMDFRYEKDKFGFFYTKSFRVQYIIYKELGTEKYHDFVVDTYNTSYLKDVNTIIDILSKYKDTDWNSILSGWVIPGKYTKYKLDKFD